MNHLYLCVPLLCLLFISACSYSYSGELHFVEPDSADTFTYPYFLYLPEDLQVDQKIYLVVEPNNSGFADDDFSKHLEKAERTATRDFYIGNYVAEQLRSPLLVPVFPRPRSDWNVYTHALDRDVMLIRDHPLERIDLQLLSMITDARNRLLADNIYTHPQILLTGFSASASFANRFTLLHPENVKATAAGGLNGLLMLPEHQLNSDTLIYPIGTGDFKQIKDTDFNRDAFLSTPQFYFMGALDENDAVPYNDAYSDRERELIYSFGGGSSMSSRWDTCRFYYKKAGVRGMITTYPDLGHEQTSEVKQDILSFFKKHIEDEKISMQNGSYY